MDLKCLLPHMLGQPIQVGDRTYQIGPDGFCRGLSDEHASRLLSQEGAWERPQVRRPPAAAKPAPTPEPAPPADEADEADPEARRGRRRGR